MTDSQGMSAGARKLVSNPYKIRKAGRALGVVVKAVVSATLGVAALGVGLLGLAVALGTASGWADWALVVAVAVFFGVKGGVAEYRATKGAG